jgi:basic membrane protein A
VNTARNTTGHTGRFVTRLLGDTRRRRVGLAALSAGVTLAGAVAFASPGAASAAVPAALTSTGKLKACMVTDVGGINDRSFNQTSWLGMQQAHKADPNITISYLQSESAASYAPEISTFIKQKCGIIVTVGFDLNDATLAAAKAHPTQKFAIVDNEYTPAVKNIRALTYETDQDAFLGGYLAAAYTKTGTVGTFGGQNIPTVTIYMNGFVAGVRYYNQANKKSVKVLGWNPNTNKGEFTNSFTDQTQGKSVTQTEINSGADIIFPVAGNVGLGAAQAVQSAGAGHYMEWVDTDGCVSAPQYCSLFLTSVTKGLNTSVGNILLQTANGKYQGGNYIGTLANGGVALSPFHNFASKIPAAVQTKLKSLTTGIESGKISVNPKKYPASS